MRKEGSKRYLNVLALFAAVFILLTVVVDVPAVQVDIYSGYTDPGEGGTSKGGAPYSGVKQSFYSPDVMFATNTNYSWHPFDYVTFGAELFGEIDIQTRGYYEFTLDSDDGSMLFVDGFLFVDNGEDRGHPPRKVSSVAFVEAGPHPFRIEFFEDFGDPSGLDFTYRAVPEPFTLLLLGLGLLGIVGFRRKTG